MKFFPQRVDWQLGLSASILAFMLLVPPSSLAGEPLPALRAFVGEYEHIGGEAEKKAWEEAIEEAVAGLNFLLRPLARPYLRYRIDIPEDLTIRIDGDKLYLRFGEKSGETAVVNGPWLTEGEGEKALRIHHAFDRESTEIVQQIINDRGVRKRFLRLKDGGDRLRLRTIVESKQLSAPIDYQLNFRRVRQ